MWENITGWQGRADPAREEIMVCSSNSLWRGEVSSSSLWKPECGSLGVNVWTDSGWNFCQDGFIELLDGKRQWKILTRERMNG